MLYPNLDRNIGSRSRVAESPGGGGAATAAAGLAAAAALSTAAKGPMSTLGRYMSNLMDKLLHPLTDIPARLPPLSWDEFQKWLNELDAPPGWTATTYGGGPCAGSQLNRYCRAGFDPSGACPSNNTCSTDAASQFNSAGITKVWKYQNKSVTTGKVDVYYNKIDAGAPAVTNPPWVEHVTGQVVPVEDTYEDAKNPPHRRYFLSVWPDAVRPVSWAPPQVAVPVRALSHVAIKHLVEDFPERSHRGNAPPVSVPVPIPGVGAEAPAIPRPRAIPGTTVSAPGRVVPRVRVLPGVQAVRIPSKVPERKVHVTQYGHPVGNIVGKATEILDAVDCIAEGLPEAVKRDLRRNGEWNSLGKAGAIADWWPVMDLQKSLTECAKQNAIDFVGAAFGKAVASVGAGLGLPVGLGTLQSVLGIKPKMPSLG